MGTWGDGVYDNDCALDFLNDLEARGVSAITAAFKLPRSSYLQCDAGFEALAAADVLCRLYGGSRPVQAQANLWCHTNRHPKHMGTIQRALIALDRIEDPASSEAPALFGPVPNPFTKNVDTLRTLLQGLAG